MAKEVKMKSDVTAILLNWKRPDNLKRLIASIRSQTVQVEILLWNNSDNATTYDVDLQINSSTNLMCWPRWMLASYASAEYVFVMDDDIMPSDNHVVCDCINYCNKSPLTAIGYTGVILNAKNDYWASKHLLHPNRHVDTHVNIIKGRFMFMAKCLLNYLTVVQQPSLLGPRVEDDIIVSSTMKTKVLPRFLVDRLTELPEGNVSLKFQADHRQSRQDAVARYFA